MKLNYNKIIGNLGTAKMTIHTVHSKIWTVWKRMDQT